MSARTSSTWRLSPEDVIPVIYTVFFLFLCWAGWFFCFLVGQDSDSSYPGHSPTESGSFGEDWTLEIRTRDCLTAPIVLWTCYLMCTHTHLLPNSVYHHIPFSKCTQILFRSQVLNHSEMNLSVWLHKVNRLEKYILSNRERNSNQRSLTIPFLSH